MSLIHLRGAGLRLALAGEVPIAHAAAIARKTDSEPPAARVVCVYCQPHHVISEGVEPVSHGACEIGVERFESGARA